MTTFETVNGFPAQKRNRLALIFALLILANTLLVLAEPPGSTTNLAGDTVSGWKLKYSVILGLILGYTLLGCLLATLINLIPYKGMRYGQKYLRTALITVIGLQVSFFLLELRAFLHNTF